MAQEWSFVGVSTDPSTTDDPIVSVPSGTQNGDQMYAVVTAVSDIGTPTIATPSGWTLIQSDLRTDLGGLDEQRTSHFRRVASSEPASYTFDCGGHIGAIGAIYVVRMLAGFQAITAVRNTLNVTSHPADTLTIATADSCALYVAVQAENATSWTPPGGYTERVDTTFIFGGLVIADKNVPTGSTGSPTGVTPVATSAMAYLVAFRAFVIGESTLRGVASMDQSLGSVIFTPQASLQGVARITAEGQGIPFLDFTRYDAYIEALGQVRGLIFYDEQQPETVPVPLQPTRSDVGNNPDEIRPEFGNFFAQSDFSGGAGQTYFHQPGRDPKRFFYSEGFEIAERGRLTHLRAIGEAHDSATIGALAQVGDLPFVISGTRIRRGDGAFPGTWTEENPHVAEGDQTPRDLAAEGARLFAALGVNGVHVRSSGGTWSHYQPDGSTNLNTGGTATKVARIKGRLMVVGGTVGGGVSIYEIAATSTPTPLETLPEGWTFEEIFEAGAFVHACAVNANAGLSRVHHYGLNATLSALEKKSSTPFPQGQLIYAGTGFPGLAFIGGGKRNSSGGYDPILYQATIDPTTGELDYTEIREEEGSSSNDLSIRSIATMGEVILSGWSLGSGAYGGPRDGIAVYHIAREAFAHHLKKTGAGGGKRISDIMPYKGRVLISIQGDGLYYEDLAAYVTTAELVTSLADWNNAGQKVWDFVEVSHDGLPASTSVKVEHAIKSQEVATWAELFTSDIDNAEGASSRVSNVKTRVFALRITSTATASASPVFLGYSARSLPSPTQPEFKLTRYVRLLARDRKDEDGQPVLADPRETLRYLQDALFSDVNFFESGFSWTAWLDDVSTVEPAQPFYESTRGEPLKDAYVVRMQMTGTR